MNGIRIINTIICLSAAVVFSMPCACGAGEEIKITEDAATPAETQTNENAAAAVSTDSGEINLMPRASESAGNELNSEPLLETKAAGSTGEIKTGKKLSRTEEIWLRMKSRFKTSEIEAERKKYARAAGEQTGEIEEYEDETGSGDTAETYFESVGTKEVSTSGEVKIKAKKMKKVKKGGTGEIALDKKRRSTSEVESAHKTAEVKIESGENLFFRRCYSCHFDHAHFKMANNLAGKEFWLKYNKNEAGIKKVIRNGFRTTAGDMPAYAVERLSDREAEAIIEHLKSMSQPLKIESKKKTAAETKTESGTGAEIKSKTTPKKENGVKNKNIKEIKKSK